MHISRRRSTPTPSSPIRRGRPSGMTRARTLQRLVIAEALVQGTRIATIARTLRVSRSWASREANALQTRDMLASMLNNRAESFYRHLQQKVGKVSRDASLVSHQPLDCLHHCEARR